MDFNLTFIMGLRKEWRNVSLMVKTQQSFDTSTLNDLYNLLKTHEPEVIKMDEESMLRLGGPLALVSKVSKKEATKKESFDDEGLIVNLVNETIAF